MTDSSSRLKLQQALQQEGLRLLVRREHSREELRRKLLSKARQWPTEEAVAAEVLVACVESALEGLSAKRWQSDQRYAAQRVQQRGARYGNQRLRQELGQSGVNDEVIAAALDGAEDEGRRCWEVWQKKFGQKADTREGLAKQARFLQYRGFSSETIRRVLRQAGQDTDLSEELV